MGIAEKLKKYRKHNNLSQSDMAKKLNVSLRTYQNYESGETDPNRMGVYKKIMQILSYNNDDNNQDQYYKTRLINVTGLTGSEKIEFIMKTFGVNQSEIADMTGEAAGNISKYKSGKLLPSSNFLEKLEKAFHFKFVTDQQKLPLSQRLRKYREENNLTQYEMAYLLGYKIETYQTYEHGKTENPHADNKAWIEHFISTPYIHRKDKEGFRERIRQLIDEYANGDIEEFSKRSGLSKAVSLKYKSGDREFPKQETIEKICQAYNINEYWLITGIGDKREMTQDEDASGEISRLNKEIAKLKDQLYQNTQKSLDIIHSQTQKFSETKNQESKKISANQSEKEKEAPARSK